MLLLHTLAPVFLLIAAGVALRRWCGFSDGAELSRLLYWVALPAQLVWLTSRTDVSANLPLAGLAVVALATFGGMAVALLLVRRLPPAEQGSLINGATRPNGAFIGLPIVGLAAAHLPAEAGARLAGSYAVLLGPSVAVFNIGAVLAFRLPHHGGGAAGTLRSLADLPRNPLLIAVALGTALGLWRPGCLEGTVPGTVLGMLAAGAVPLALLAAGLGLDFAALHGRWGRLGAALAAKLVLVPLACWGGCRLLGLDPVATAAVTVLMASPVAMASVPMARALGGDPALMAALVTATTAAAPATMLAWLWLVL
ncbi:MAG: AEC family transporter [Planctomycetes bacterium]|nr:AEC family transporter [Planctomycetota bacterium]